MKLLQSKLFELPKLFFISNKAEIDELPIGVPFFYGDEHLESAVIRVLEYEILYQSALKSGFDFNFKKILRQNGFNDIQDFDWIRTEKLEYHTTSGGTITTEKINHKGLFDTFIEDVSCYVDINVLKSLNVFPIWMQDLETALTTNIHNHMLYTPNSYNKKLGGMYGNMELQSLPRNLIISDLSGSIPKAVATMELTLAKHLGESFYADILFTGSKSILYTYEELHTLDVKEVYDEVGLNNEAVMFRKLLSSDDRVYNTCICIGDNHSPLASWHNCGALSQAAGKRLCRWKINKLISLHTTSNTDLAGYSDMFEPKEVEIIKDWVTYLN